jgi:DNA-binding FrmR family transcriptional regulator
MGVYNADMRKIKKDASFDASRRDLINRLSRIEGQIAALKGRIAEGREGACTENLGQIKAVHSALKRFAESYVEAYALGCAHKEKVSPQFQEDIRTIIASAFLI